MPQHRFGQFGSRFIYENALETAFQRGIFFDVALVFRERSGTDGLDVAARQGRLEDIGGIQPAGGIAGPDQSMDFVYKEDDIGVGFGFAQDFLEARLEFSAKGSYLLRRAPDRGKDALADQLFWYIAAANFFGQAAHQRRFADAWFAR